MEAHSAFAPILWVRYTTAFDVAQIEIKRNDRYLIGFVSYWLSVLMHINRVTGTSDFESVHRRFRPRVLRYLTRLVGDAHAEDVTQSAMLKIAEGLPGFDGRSNISTWIYRIATNAAIDKLRGKTLQTVSDAELDADEGPVPPQAQVASAEAHAIRQEMSGCIAEYVAALPRNYRAVMVLSEIEGFKNEQIAEILGVSLDTVKIRLHRGRQKLRKALEAGCSLSRDQDNELACDRKPLTPIAFRPRR